MRCACCGHDHPCTCPLPMVTGLTVNAAADQGFRFQTLPFGGVTVTIPVTHLVNTAAAPLVAEVQIVKFGGQS